MLLITWLEIGSWLDNGEVGRKLNSEKQKMGKVSKENEERLIM